MSIWKNNFYNNLKTLNVYPDFLRTIKNTNKKRKINLLDNEEIEDNDDSYL